MRARIEPPPWAYLPQREQRELVMVSGQNFKDVIVTLGKDGVWRGKGVYERKEADFKAPMDIEISYEKKLSEKHGSMHVVATLKDERLGDMDTFDLTFKEKGFVKHWKFETAHEIPLGEVVKMPEWEKMLKGFLEYEKASNWLSSKKKELSDGKIISKGLRQD